MSKSYFPDPMRSDKTTVFDFLTDWRVQIALDLIEHFGVVAGTLEGEDSQGRARLGLQTPREVVERALAITDLAVQAFEDRGWIKPVGIDVDTIHENIGRLTGIQERARYEESDKRHEEKAHTRMLEHDLAKFEAASETKKES